MLRCYSCGNLVTVEPSGLCPRCLALRPATTDEAEPAQRGHFRCPATWSIIFITILTSILGFLFRESGAPFGADIQWRAIGGSEWWRLLTGFFVHEGFWHVFTNLFILWIVGKRLERIQGARGFLGVYLTCGLAGSVAALAFDPERTCFGASGAVFGVSTAVIAIYSIRHKTLTNSQKWRLGFFVFFTAGSLVAGFFDKEIDNPGHLGGVVSGLVLGVLFTTRFARTMPQRARIFAGMGVILLSACIWIRLTHPYLTHINAAERALDHRRYGDAARELHLALALKPGSPLAQHMVFLLQGERRPQVNYCVSLPLNSFQPVRFYDPCRALQCDGQLHTSPTPDGTTAYYLGTITASTPLETNGRREKEITAIVTMQDLDEFGEIGCTVKRSQVSRQKVDVNGNSVDKPMEISESSATISVFDPQAEALHKLILSGKH